MAIYNAQQIAQTAANAGFVGNGLAMAIAIALAESAGNTTVVNSAGDVGLWQINQPLHPQYSTAYLQDANNNASVAYKLSSGGTNWRPWCTAYSDGACGTRGGIYQGTGSPYQRYIATGVAYSGTKASNNNVGGLPPTTQPIATQPPVTPAWCKPFMAHSIAWNESNLNHYPTSPEGWPEGGVDWTPSPNNLPITALLPGTVIGAGYFCKDGSSNQFCRSTYQGCSGAQGYGVVTIRSNNPLPNLVPGKQIDIYYQHILIDGSIRIPHCDGSSGETVQAGQVIGRANGSFNVEVGVNIGASWGTIWGTNSPGPHVDPIPFLWTLINSGVGSTNSPGTPITGSVGFSSGVPGTYIPLLEQVHQTLTNIPGFYGIALALDEAEQFPGYVDLTTPQSITLPSIDAAGISVGGGSLPVPDINGTIRSIGATITDNFVPFAIRSGITLCGALILLAILWRVVEGPVQSLAPLLEMAA